MSDQNQLENKTVEPGTCDTSASTPQKVTSIEKKTKPKDPGRVAAGKKLAELNKKRREESKAQERQQLPLQTESKNGENKISNDIKSSFSLTQALSASSQYYCLSGWIVSQKTRVEVFLSGFAKSKTT